MLLAFSLGAIANAQVVNPSFESDPNYSTTITGWQRSGHGFTANTALFSTPTKGTYQAVMATGLDGQFNEPAGSGVAAGAAETFLGLSAGSLAAVGNGDVAMISSITQTIHLDAGDKLSFDYNFLTNAVYNDHTAANADFAIRPDADANDFGFFTVSGGAISSVTKLIDVFYGYQNTSSAQDGFNTGFVPTPSTDPFFSESGYQTYTYTATATGNYKIGFGVTDAYTGSSNPLVNSGLEIDNVRVVAAVPEPATMAALGLGVAALLRRRKRA